MASVTVIVVDGDSTRQQRSRSTRRSALFGVLFGLILGCAATGCLWWAVAAPAAKTEQPKSPSPLPPRPQRYMDDGTLPMDGAKLPPRVQPVFRSNPLPRPR